MVFLKHSFLVFCQTKNVPSIILHPINEYSILRTVVSREKTTVEVCKKTVVSQSYVESEELA